MNTAKHVQNMYSVWRDGQKQDKKGRTSLGFLFCGNAVGLDEELDFLSLQPVELLADTRDLPVIEVKRLGVLRFVIEDRFRSFKLRLQPRNLGLQRRNLFLQLVNVTHFGLCFLHNTL
jgi:hypothetical protein